MNLHSPGRGLRRVLRLSGFAALCGLLCVSLSAGAQSPTKRLPGHLPALVAESNLAGPQSPKEMLDLALVLPIRNSAQLDALSRSLYDPNDPQYGKYLTAAQFTEQFGPTQADYDLIASYVQAQGLTVTTKHSNRLVLDVQGTAKAVQAAFGVTLHQYKAPNGRIFRAPDADPLLPTPIADRLQGIIGLDTAGVLRRPPTLRPVDPLAAVLPTVPTTSGDPFGLLPFDSAPVSKSGGSGPGGGFTPSDLRTAYNLNNLSYNGVTLNGAGQVMGLVEFDGYTPSDITAYETRFGLANTPLQNVLIDGFNGNPTGTGGEGEVTLDIQMMVAFASGASKIIVYEAPGSQRSFIDEFNRMATDNLAKSISDSWGFSGEPFAFSISEDAIFRQFVAQGQSFYSASGDDGAYYNGRTLGPTDPSSPNIVTVGGTALTTNGAGGTWRSETTWNGGVTVPFVPQNNGGSGGGISSIFPVPYYQAGLGTTANRGSTTNRMMPDIALDADPNTGQYIIIGGQGYISGGTSAAAPLWAAFNALVNQKRALLGKAPLGFPNPALYSIAAGPNYNLDLHDIRDNSTNLFYPAVTGYDLATGLGTINGSPLLDDLAGGVGNTAPIISFTERMGNGSFENGAGHPLPWYATLGVINNNGKEPSSDGVWKAWLCGYGAPHTDTLYQTVTIPSQATIPVNSRYAALSFDLLVDSDPLLTRAYDTLSVQVRSSTGTTLATLATYSNLNYTAGNFARVSFDMKPYIGQTVQVYLIGRESGYKTSFVTDAFSLLSR